MLGYVLLILGFFIEAGLTPRTFADDVDELDSIDSNRSGRRLCAGPGRRAGDTGTFVQRLACFFFLTVAFLGLAVGGYVS
jgi:hypothetical protein